MTPAVLTWLRGQKLLVKQEFALPWGVCDVVGASLNRRHVQKRLDLRQRDTVGPISRIGVLLSLPDGDSNVASSLHDLHQKFGAMLTKEEISAELETLMRRRFVRGDGKGSFHKLNGWMPLHERLVVVELKRDRIDDVLCQARKNKELTWESYVGLPVALARRVLESNKRLEFENAGVGLLGVSRRRVELLFSARPNPSTVCPLVQIHCVERFWRSRLTGN